MASITITISSPGRALVADGRLVAGESADVSVVGGVPAALYLVDATRDVVAACTSFVAGESSATGELNLATVPLAEIVAEIPAGRAIPLQAILEDAAGAVIGYGLLNVVSAPMPDALDPLDEDLIYAKLSDLRAYLTRAEADERYAPIDAATPIAPSANPADKGKPADAYQTGRQLAGKQDTLSDLATIRAGAAAGATAYQLPITGIPATDLAAAVRTSLGKADTALQSAPVSSVNGQTGAVTLDADDIAVMGPGSSVAGALERLNVGKVDVGDLGYALGDAITASADLLDRTVNRVAPLADNASDITLTFPSAIDYARDFLCLVTNTAGNTGSITFSPPSGAMVYGDGFSNAPASGETWFYAITEVAENTFWVKSEKMEVAS